jgi:hypothetical protein
MIVNAASRTNEKLYQTRQLLQLLASSESSTRSLNNGLLNAAVFSLQGAYLAFLLEIALAHRVKLSFIESLHQLVPLLEKMGVADLAVRELQQLYADGRWPAWLLGWYRAALGDDGWKAATDKPARENSIIGIVDLGASSAPEPTSATVLDVLEKLRLFIEAQREHLLEW